MFKRLLSLAMAVFILFLFSACDTVQTPVSPEASHTEKNNSEFYARLDELETIDYEGRAFRIATYQANTVFPENTDTLLDRSLKSRNESVEKKFNIKLKNAAIPQETFFSTLRDAYDNGEDVCDIVVAPRSMAASFLAGDMLLNVNSLPYTNYKKSYFDSAAMNAASLGSVTYEIAGDFVAAPASQWAVCYNITLMEWFGFDSFVKLARNEQWTWDKFYSWISMFYKDLNRDRVMTDKDLFGVTCSAADETLAKAIWASAGIPFFDNQAPFAPSMNFDNEGTAEMLKVLKRIMQTPSRYSETTGKKSALDMFLDDQALFYICPASTVGYLQLQGKNVGMLPLPKLNAEQKNYHSYVDSSTPVVYVLNNCADTEYVGRIVQALFAASENIIFENTMQIYSAYHLTGNAALNFFIDMVKHGYYDPAFVLGDAFPEVNAASWGIINNCLFLKGDFDALYENQLKAFNETYASDSIHSKEDGLPDMEEEE